jgi:endo-1,4-beta-xylanase
MFIWHTATDELVPVIGSLSLAKRMAELKLPLKVSIYPYGPHGVALANEVTKCGNENWLQPMAESWVREAAEFAKTLKDS